MADSLVPVKEIEEKMETDKMWIIMGPQHPFSHGLWTLKIQVDGEIVTDAEPIVGYLHRGWEKEAENRIYPKIIPMADRLCYAASMTYTHLYCMTVEKALGIDIPEKAKYIRIVADEVCRINSHLMWLAAVGTDLGNLTVFLWAMREREYFLDLNVKLCGARMTTNYPRIGGVRNDLTELFDRDILRTVDRFEKAMYADPEQDLNALWRDLVEKYQLLTYPEGRDEPDWAAKIHIALYPCYYHNYQMGELFASQMHHYIVENITRSGDMVFDSYTGCPDVGRWLSEKIFAPGKLYPWNEMIIRATGEPLTASYWANEVR